jgi:hypothetical protein
VYNKDGKRFQNVEDINGENTVDTFYLFEGCDGIREEEYNAVKKMVSVPESREKWMCHPSIGKDDILEAIADVVQNTVPSTGDTNDFVNIEDTKIPLNVLHKKDGWVRARYSGKPYIKDQLLFRDNLLNTERQA